MFISIDIKLHLYHSTINTYQVKTKNTEKTLNKLKKTSQYNPIQKQVVKSSIQHQIVDGLCQFRINNTILRNLINPEIDKIGQVLLDEEGWNYMVIVFHVNEEMVGE